MPVGGVISSRAKTGRGRTAVGEIGEEGLGVGSEPERRGTAGQQGEEGDESGEGGRAEVVEGELVECSSRRASEDEEDEDERRAGCDADEEGRAGEERPVMLVGVPFAGDVCKVERVPAKGEGGQRCRDELWGRVEEHGNDDDDDDDPDPAAHRSRPVLDRARRPRAQHRPRPSLPRRPRLAVLNARSLAVPRRPLVPRPLRCPSRPVRTLSPPCPASAHPS